MNRNSTLKRGTSQLKRAQIARKTDAARMRTRRAMQAKPDRELVKWSNDVRVRDEWTCQRPSCPNCYNVPNTRNVAHHVAPRGRRRDLKYDRANGLTVCPETHNWIHFVDPIAATEAGLLNDETYELAAKESAARATQERAA